MGFPSHQVNPVGCGSGDDEFGFDASVVNVIVAERVDIARLQAVGECFSQSRDKVVYTRTPSLGPLRFRLIGRQEDSARLRNRQLYAKSLVGIALVITRVHVDTPCSHLIAGMTCLERIESW